MIRKFWCRDVRVVSKSPWITRGSLFRHRELECACFGLRGDFVVASRHESLIFIVHHIIFILAHTELSLSTRAQQRRVSSYWEKKLCASADSLIGGCEFFSILNWPSHERRTNIVYVRKRWWRWPKVIWRAGAGKFNDRARDRETSRESN